MSASSNANTILSKLKTAYPDARYYLNFSNPLELLVAAILSAQVRDTVVNSVTPALFKKYKTASAYAKADRETLLREIMPVTFPANKARHIQEACRIIHEQYQGTVPDTMEELVALPGIGRKTAHAILINAFGKVEGIVVDTHVIRVAYRLGWTRHKDPEKIERDLIQIIPRKEWMKTPWLLKAHGRAVCKAPTPDCRRCILEPLCPKH